MMLQSCLFKTQLWNNDADSNAGNESITLVATVVEGSTKLWEWNKAVVDVNAASDPVKKSCFYHYCGAVC